MWLLKGTPKRKPERTVYVIGVPERFLRGILESQQVLTLESLAPHLRDRSNFLALVRADSAAELRRMMGTTLDILSVVSCQPGVVEGPN